MNLILIGCPGAGKGTQAEKLTEEFGIRHFSTGNIFREEIANKTELGLKLKRYLDKGHLVPDSLVLDIVREKIEKEERGFLFDGFPRTLEQAEALDGIFKNVGKKISAVVVIDLSEEEVVARISNRRTCGKCKQVYNYQSKTPKVFDKCDKCGGDLILRDDDKPETIRERMKVYRNQTAPLIEYYKTGNNFLTVDGSKTPAEVTKSILDGLAKLNVKSER
jgi:adenylate kinase